MSDLSNPAVIVDRVLQAIEESADPYSTASLPAGFGSFALPAGTPPMSMSEAKARRAKLREIIANDPAGAALGLGEAVSGFAAVLKTLLPI